MKEAKIGIFCDRAWIRPGCRVENLRVEVENGLIASLREGASRKKGDRYFPEATALPGLVNAHVHLELTALRGQLKPGTSFSHWVKSLQAFLRDWTQDDYRRSFLSGLDCSLRCGVTTLCDTGNSGVNLENYSQTSPKNSPRIAAFLELLGLEENQASQNLQQAEKLAGQTGKFAVPHAVFSCHPLLLRTLMQNAGGRGSWGIHLDESREERELLTTGRGDLADFLGNIFPGHHLKTGGFTNSLDYLLSGNLLPSGALLTHCNEVQEFQWQVLREKDCSVVYCPGSHDFFSHRELKLEAMLKSGLRVCLGTDSLASTPSLDLWQEALRVKKKHRGISDDQLMAMVTTSGAEALGLQDLVGSLEVGKSADILFVQNDTRHPFDFSVGIPKLLGLLCRGVPVDEVLPC